MDAEEMEGGVSDCYLHNLFTQDLTNWLIISKRDGISYATEPVVFIFCI